MTHGGTTIAIPPNTGVGAATSEFTPGWQPRVSVLMAAYNASAFIAAAIQSILWQTYQDFELIIVDDCSTDDTAEIIRSFHDPRIRLLSPPRNLGVVQARNLGFANATGAYLAIHDADDISHPTRLARQVGHMDSHPGDVLVSADIRQLHPGGEMLRTRYQGSVTPRLLEWMLHLGNPIAFSSTLMRMAALRRLPEFLREDRRYAEDFDVYARLRGQGGFARLPVPLLVYRVYPESTSARYRVRMVEQTGRVLDEIWPSELFAGHERLGIAAMAARHLACGEPADSAEVLERLRAAIDALIEHFLAHHPECSDAERDAVALYASRVWENMVRLSLRAGTVSWPSGRGLRRGGLLRLGFSDFLGSALRGALPKSLRRLLRAEGDEATLPDGRLLPDAVARPPVLYISVVLEGTAAPQGGSENRQSAAFALQAQEIFDIYGLRPAYLLDRAIADQPTTCAALRNVQDAGGCVGGVWWPADAAGRDLPGLRAAVTAALGVPPRAASAEALASLGGQAGAAAELTGFPLTGGVVVAVTPLLDRLAGPGMGQSDAPLAGMSNRADLTRQVMLLPHELASEPQIILIKNLLAKGERDFFLRLHIRQGSTGTALALDRLRRICTYFFEDLGGLPGSDLARTGGLGWRRGHG